MIRDIAGRKYARLTGIKTLPKRTRDGHRIALWLCECGAQPEIATSRVINGYTQSCGCALRDYIRAAKTTHGMRYTKEYGAWANMIDRCCNQSSKDFANWGGRGIRICKEWRESFEQFFAHIGSAPTAKHQIDRINNNGHYEPGNVRWASIQEQATNRRTTVVVVISGVKYESQAEAARSLNVTPMTISRWCDGSFDPRRGVSTKPKPGCRKENRILEEVC